MPASRPRKAKPVEMRRTERLWTAFDQSQATSPTAMPTTAICQSNPRKCSSCSEKRICCRGGRLGVDVVTAQDSCLGKRQSRRRISNVASNGGICNVCFMAEQPSKSSPLNELCSALPSLPTRLQEVGRFVAANDYDATTRSMRELAAVAGADPAAFTRLAKAIGYSGWDELRAALTEARRPPQSSPFSGRARGRRQGPNADVSLVSDKLEAEAAGLSRIVPDAVAKAARALHAARRIWIAGFRSCRSVAELLNYQLRLFRPDAVRLIGAAGPEDLDFGGFRAGDAVVVIGFAPYSRSSVLAAHAAREAECKIVALADTP